MNRHVLVFLALLALIGSLESRPQEETIPVSQQVKQSDEVGENKDDQLKSGNESTVASTESAVEGKSGDKNGDPNSVNPKVKQATDEAFLKEKTGDSSIESASTATPVDEGKSGQDSNNSKSGESIEAPNIDGKKGSEEKSATKVEENKSGNSENSVVAERTGAAEKTGAAESRENKEPEVEPKSAAEVSTSTEAVQSKSAYGSSSILETKGRTAGETAEESEESNSSEIKGRAHVKLRVPPVNPLAVVNDIGSRRMGQPNLMLNLPQSFAPPFQQIDPKNLPAPFNRYLNAAPSVLNVATVTNPNQRSFNDGIRPETNAYPYSPTSSQQVDSLPKLPTLRDLSKLSSYPNTFYKPYDQNFSGNFGDRPRRYTVPDTMNRYAFTGFGYPHYAR